MSHSQMRVSSEIIQIYFNNIFKIVKDQGHGPLNCSSDVFKVEGHLRICKSSPRTNKCGLVLILRFNLNLIIPKKAVHKGKYLASCTLIQNLVYEWCGEFIFRTGLIQVFKVSAHPDSSILLIYGNRVENPFSKGNQIDKARFE